jgi:uncharacterized spore protein YtfJ
MSNLNANLETLFSKMENFISTKTVVGEPLNIGDMIIVPLVDVAFGVGAGSTDSSADKDKKESGAGGLGAKISPSAVIVIGKDGNIQLVNIKNQSAVNKLIDMVPGITSKLNFGFNKSKSEDETGESFKDERVSE